MIDFVESFLLNVYLYAFLSWTVEVALFALWDRRFKNRGFLNLPVNLTCGMAAAISLVALPTLEHNLPLQYLLILIVYGAVRRIAEQFVRNRRPEMVLRPAGRFWDALRVMEDAVISGAFLVIYLVVNPLVQGALLLVPRWLIHVGVIGAAALTLMDYLCVRYTIRTAGAQRRMEGTQALARRITDGVWRRIERAYPEVSADSPAPSRAVFAQGICRDKLVWVFLISSFLGAMIEMVYCRVSGGVWMNRSSVLYGSFSFVWGFGAVVLTVVLQRLIEHNDRWVFLAGCVIGGAYEYLCSVFTEAVFGTVFWDYSHMRFSIGGRTNLVYCVFWGLLAVMWIKVLYPPMDRFIEKFPPLGGRLLTWIIVFVMACNGLLTAGAMIRYTQRQTNPEAAHVAAAFFDARYDDAWMRERWPNMVISGAEAAHVLPDADSPGA